MRRLSYYFDLVLTFFKLNIKKIVEYRTDFLIGTIPLIVTRILGIVFIGLVFKKIPNLNGWNFEQVLFIYSFYTLASGVYLIIFDNLRSLKAYIFSGTFDRVLVQPLPPLLYILLLSFNEYSLGQLILGVIIMGYAMQKMAIAVSLVTILLLAIFVILGALILGSLSLLATSVLFYTEGLFSPLNAIRAMEQFIRYPLTIFNKYIQIFLTWVLPLGFVSFYPAVYFIPNYQPPFPVLLVCPLLVLVFLTVSVKVFNSGFKKYLGTGS